MRKYRITHGISGRSQQLALVGVGISGKAGYRVEVVRQQRRLGVGAGGEGGGGNEGGGEGIAECGFHGGGFLRGVGLEKTRACVSDDRNMMRMHASVMSHKYATRRGASDCVGVRWQAAARHRFPGDADAPKKSAVAAGALPTNPMALLHQSQGAADSDPPMCMEKPMIKSLRASSSSLHARAIRRSPLRALNERRTPIRLEGASPRDQASSVSIPDLWVTGRSLPAQSKLPQPRLR